MTQVSGFLYNDVAIAVVIEVVKVRTTKPRGLNGYLHLIRFRRRETAVFLYENHVNRRIKMYADEVTNYSEIFYAVQDRSPYSRTGSLKMAVYSIRLCHDNIWTLY